MVSTLDFESSDLGSTPGGTFKRSLTFLFFKFLHERQMGWSLWLFLHGPQVHDGARVHDQLKLQRHFKDCYRQKVVHLTHIEWWILAHRATYSCVYVRKYTLHPLNLDLLLNRFINFQNLQLKLSRYCKDVNVLLLLRSSVD